MCVDKCAGMRADMCVDMHDKMFLCVDMRLYLCIGSCADMRADMCIDMCVETR